MESLETLSWSVPVLGETSAYPLGAVAVVDVAELVSTRLNTPLPTPVNEYTPVPAETDADWTTEFDWTRLTNTLGPPAQLSPLSSAELWLASIYTVPEMLVDRL